MNIGGVITDIGNGGVGSDDWCGQYYSWGEVEIESTSLTTANLWKCYKWGSNTNISKYNISDGLTRLEPDDVVIKNYGGQWAIPTRE